MTDTARVTTLFLDIGGVLLTNGWDHHARRLAVTHFNLEWDEVEPRHQLNFATYEEGKLTLDEYLTRTMFYADRPLTREQFREFMTAQSQSEPGMLDLMARLKVRYGLRVAAVCNEARELNAYRIREFKLDQLFECFVSSCFVHVRKPDLDIFRLALDIVQTPPERIVYIDTTAMFVHIAEAMGIRGIIHTDYESTCLKLQGFGLRTEEGAFHESH